MKVDFMIIGAQKCATTTLFDILNKHPQLEGCAEKEPGFFAKKNWQSSLNSYHQLYKERDGAIYFEASTQYTFYPHIDNKNLIADLYQYNPNLKFIYLVRSPIDRIISSYIHGYQREFIKKDINQELMNNPFFIDISMYATQIRPYIKMFQRENVLVIDFDDFTSDQYKVVNQVCQFLNIELETSMLTQNQHSNKSLGNVKLKKQYTKTFNLLKKMSHSLPSSINDILKRTIRDSGLFTGEKITKKPSLTPETISFIQEQLRSDIDELEDIMGRSLASWK
ncbi:sulfotransferase [Methylophaga marina]|uniref:Sulfotransferase domain-containing protein n=1 Tax=Methylophaga marina TaxID=45495 RepID=A0ABP3D8X2_9GAMM